MTPHQKAQVEAEAVNWAEKYSFHVPYDGSKSFNDESALKHGKNGFIAGAEYLSSIQDEWISVKDQMPNVDQLVCVIIPKEDEDSFFIPFITKYKGDGYFRCKRVDDQSVLDYSSNISHWRPIPTLPKKESNTQTMNKELSQRVADLEMTVSALKKQLKEVPATTNSTEAEAAKEWLINFLIKNAKNWRVVMDIEEQRQVWHLGDKWIFEVDLKNKIFWCYYYKVWEVLHTKYNMNYDEIQQLIRDVVLKPFNCEGFTPNNTYDYFTSRY